MIRILVFFLILAVSAFGIAWLLERPGEIVLTWQGYRVETSVAVGLGVLFVAAAALAIVWGIIRFVFRLPSVMAMTRRMRRRNKGYAALSRGMIAAGAGDARLARKSAAEAGKHLPDEPLALLLAAQAAQLSGDRERAEAAFHEMAGKMETRLLGLRGLHIEAHRRGDADAAHHFAHEAHKIAPLPWSAQAVLRHRAANSNWQEALTALESHIKAKLVDKATGERQRAVLETAIALDKAAIAPDEALRLARSALRREPDLVPAVAMAARLFSRKGEIRKAAKLIETAWPRSPHPELADVYLDLRPGDSNADRLIRAKTLMRLAPRATESRLALARTALFARDFKAAREAMAPLIADREGPTARMCLIMAEIEETEHGAQGAVRQWLARASRAPRDEAWIADGIAVDQWAPASPVSGRLDAFVWQKPVERLSADLHGSEAPGSEVPEPPSAQTAIPLAPSPIAEITLQETVKETSQDTPLDEVVLNEAPKAPAVEKLVETAAAAMPVGTASDGVAPPIATSASAPPPAGVTLAAIGSAKASPPPGTSPIQSTARPVIFPFPKAPDDPGPEDPRPTDAELPKGKAGRA